MASNMETANNIIWEIYWPKYIEQSTGWTIWDDEEALQLKTALRTKMESLTREQAQEFMSEVAKADRRAEYEALKEEFEDEA